VILYVSNYEKGFRTLFRGPFSFAGLISCFLTVS